MTHDPYDEADDDRTAAEPACDDERDPPPLPGPVSYHWTPRLERHFLESLAASGSVKIACQAVSMTPRAAYDRRNGPHGAVLRLGWAAAVLIARDRLADELLERAIWGIEEEHERVVRQRDGLNRYTRRRHDPRLGLAMLARLDRLADTRAKEGMAMFAQIVVGDWAGFLQLCDCDLPGGDDADAAPDAAADAAPGRAAALGLWLASRDNRANPLASLWRGSAIANEVARISAENDAAPAAESALDPTPEQAAAAMTVWYDEAEEEWRTSFPPPPGFLGVETGMFGADDYERSLEPEEEEAMDAAHEAYVAPLRDAGEAARRAFFHLPTPANDPARGATGSPPGGQAQARDKPEETANEGAGAARRH